MFVKSQGIVLNCIKYSETSVIARIYTREQGLLSFMINGVRTAKNTAKAAMLQAGTLLNLDFSFQENKNLLRIKEFKRAYIYHSVPFDVRKSAILLFITEIINKTLHEREVNEEQFDFLYEQLLMLDKIEEANPFYHFQFLLYYSLHLGFSPSNNFGENKPFFDLKKGQFISEKDRNFDVLNREESLLIHELLCSEIFIRPDINFQRSIRNAVLQRLLDFYGLHIETFRNVQSHIILESVFD